MARYLLAGSDPHYLKDAPDSKKYLGEDAATVERGKVVFAEVCARCHSSKLPPLPGGLDLENANGPNYLAAWNAYWAWTKTDGFKTAMRQKVLEPDFLESNYLSTRAACADHAARHQRVQSDRHQCDPQQHLGQLLVGVLQDAPLGRQHHHPASAVGQGNELSAAGGRSRLHPAGIARQRLGDRAVSSEQHGRTVRVQSVGRARGCVPSSVRSSRCSGPNGARRTTPLFGEREDADGRHHRPDHDRQLSRGARIVHLRTAPAAGQAVARRSFRSSAATARRLRVGPFPKGMPIGVDHERRRARRGPAAVRTGCAQGTGEEPGQAGAVTS